MRLLLTLLCLGFFCLLFWPAVLVLLVLWPVLWLLLLPVGFVAFVIGGLVLLAKLLVVAPVRAMTR
ncbi:MAG: hypothetical protein JSR18_10920 [Proteobacteria bacterium]|nr:hypothetical protein [Pseudomonadota bacterium]